METRQGGGRQRYSRQEWQGFVSEFLVGDQDCKSYCRDRRLNPSRFMRWQGVFRKEASLSVGEVQPVGFVDLGTLPVPTSQPRTGTLELKLDLGGGVILTLTRT